MAPKTRVKRRSAWQKKLLQLKRWFNTHDGAFPCQKGEVVGEKRLARWVNNARVRHAKGKLSQAHINKLEALPAWRWSACVIAWSDTYEELVKWFYAENDPQASRSRVRDSFPPRKSKLGEWVQTTLCISAWKATSAPCGGVGNPAGVDLEVLWSWDRCAAASCALPPGRGMAPWCVGRCKLLSRN